MRKNKMTEHILFMIFTKKRPLYFRRKLNARGIERYSKHSSPTSPPCADDGFALFSISFVIYCPFLTIKEQYQKIEYFIHVSCDENAENRNADMFVTNVLHISRQIAFPR